MHAAASPCKAAPSSGSALRAALRWATGSPRMMHRRVRPARVPTAIRDLLNPPAADTLGRGAYRRHTSCSDAARGWIKAARAVKLAHSLVYYRFAQTAAWLLQIRPLSQPITKETMSGSWQRLRSAAPGMPGKLGVVSTACAVRTGCARPGRRAATMPGVAHTPSTRQFACRSRGLSTFAHLSPKLTTVDVTKLTSAQRNLLVWEQAELPDYKVGVADLLEIATKREGLDVATVLAVCLAQLSARQTRPSHVQPVVPSVVTFTLAQFLCTRVQSYGR